MKSTILVVKILEYKYKERLYISPKRHWFDVAIYDYMYGSIPINIKSTTTKSCDNSGNLAMCVYALTNKELELNRFYNNGNMSKVLFKKIKNNKLNPYNKKDYYFVVVNKENSSQVIVNSFKGLSKMTSNVNNLPFQIKWNDNKLFVYKKIDVVKNMFIKTIQRPKPSWKEEFLANMRTLTL